VFTDGDEKRAHPTVKLFQKLIVSAEQQEQEQQQLQQQQAFDLTKHINSYGHTVLHVAASYDNDELIKLILSYPKCKKTLLHAVTYEERQTPLHHAARNGCNKAVRCLIEDFNANKEEKDSNDRTPLYLAAEYGQKYTIRRLIDFECNTNVISKGGQKALYWMVAKCPDCVFAHFVVVVVAVAVFFCVFKYFLCYAIKLKALEIFDTFRTENDLIKYVEPAYKSNDGTIFIPNTKSIVFERHFFVFFFYFFLYN
jgi:hypothetical protein